MSCKCIISLIFILFFSLPYNVNAQKDLNSEYKALVYGKLGVIERGGTTGLNIEFPLSRPQWSINTGINYWEAFDQIDGSWTLSTKVIYCWPYVEFGIGIAYWIADNNNFITPEVNFGYRNVGKKTLFKAGVGIVDWLYISVGFVID